ncbi:GntR family transcriptional regulator [Streptomyces armeniacus]|uniref:GntR family transcriptional regulator n=1 Tax=Streptomyces armeniacus TaxID=83291 RepID=A0A345XPB9_9ACTN|nr:tyrosine-type recombinase/integrase [Streptomyces armeniacus]AXK33485.1 GntR family transcriptional regulator [Streptomyces armeniacus]
MTKAAKHRRERGSIRPHGNGFQTRVYAGLDPLTKKPIYLYEQADDWGEAEKARTRLLSQVDEQRHPKSKITVGQAIDQWLAVARLEEVTRERYECAIRLYIKPALGDTAAAKLHPQTVELLYARLGRCRDQCEGRLNGRTDPDTGTRHMCAPLSNGYLRKLHYILRPALERAFRWGYLTRNPMDLVDSPPEDDPEPDPPSNAEVATLLNHAWHRDPDWATLLFLVAVTGFRRGELCALRWMNVDFDAGVLSVRRATNKRNRLKKTKTKRIRRVAIDPITADLLRAHLERQRRRAAAFGAEISQACFVFSLEPTAAEPMKKNTVTQRYGRDAHRQGLRSSRMQSLRDYSVTELIVAGVDLRTVSDRHGHSAGATTLRHYAAWVEEADRRASEILPGRLPGPNDTPPPQRELATWEKVAAELREAIQDGVMLPGSRFPTLDDLAGTYEISHGTAPLPSSRRRASSTLAAGAERRSARRMTVENPPRRDATQRDRDTLRCPLRRASASTRSVHSGEIADLRKRAQGRRQG